MAVITVKAAKPGMARRTGATRQKWLKGLGYWDRMKGRTWILGQNGESNWPLGHNRVICFTCCALYRTVPKRRRSVLGSKSRGGPVREEMLVSLPRLRHRVEVAADLQQSEEARVPMLEYLDW